LLKDSPFHIKNFDQFVEVRQQNIKDDKNHGKNQHVSPVAEETKKTIKDLDSKGWSYAKIAEKLNTTRSAISGIVYREKGTRKCKGKYD
jgi:IS30 family transposase